MAEKEVKGAVYSMVEFNGKLLASINSTVSCTLGPGAMGQTRGLPWSSTVLAVSTLPRCRLSLVIEVSVGNTADRSGALAPGRFVCELCDECENLAPHPCPCTVTNWPSFLEFMN